MEPIDVRKYYFTTYHLVRDVMGSTAVLTLFLVLGILLVPGLAYELLCIAGGMATKEPTWILGTAALVAYVLIGFASGAVANGIFVAARRVIREATKKSGWRCRALYPGYPRFYAPARTVIQRLYRRYVSTEELPVVDESRLLADRMDHLCFFFRHYDPEGFQHLYREYALVGFYRQAVVYGVMVISATVFNAITSPDGSWGRCTFAALLTLAMGLALREQIRRAIEGEYEFVVTAAAWLEQDRKQQTQVSASEPNSPR